MRPSFRGSGSVGSNGGRTSLGRGRSAQSTERDGSNMNGRSSIVSDTENQARSGDSEVQPGVHSSAQADVEVSDMGRLLSKADVSLTHPRNRSNNLAAHIRRQLVEEEETRKVREKAYDVGLIGPGGMIVDGAVDVVLHIMPKEDERINFVCVSQENGKEIDLNIEAQLGEGEQGDLDGTVESVVYAEGEGMGGGLEIMEDDPFDLVPIIEAVMKNQKGMKRPIHEVEYVEPVESCEP